MIVTCPRCNGSGTHPRDGTCSLCHGSGEHDADFYISSEIRQNELLDLTRDTQNKVNDIKEKVDEIKAVVDAL